MLAEHDILEYAPFVLVPLNLLLTMLLHRSLVVRSGSIRNKKFVELLTYLGLFAVLILSAVSIAFWSDNARFFLALNVCWTILCLIVLLVSRKYRPNIAEPLPDNASLSASNDSSSDDKAFPNDDQPMQTLDTMDKPIQNNELDAILPRKQQPGSKQIKGNLAVYRKKKSQNFNRNSAENND